MNSKPKTVTNAIAPAKNLLSHLYHRYPPSVEAWKPSWLLLATCLDWPCPWFLCLLPNTAFCGSTYRHDTFFHKKSKLRIYTSLMWKRSSRLHARKWTLKVWPNNDVRNTVINTLTTLQWLQALELYVSSQVFIHWPSWWSYYTANPSLFRHPPICPKPRRCYLAGHSH